MQATFDTVYSPDDGGYYCEFWDRNTGRAILAPNGRYLGTAIHSQRYQANKQAKKIKRAMLENRKFFNALLKANATDTCNCATARAAYGHWLSCDKCAGS